MFFVRFVLLLFSLSVSAALIGYAYMLLNKLLGLSKDDERERLTSFLPGFHCGVCGYADCAAYTDALLSGEASGNECLIASNEARRQIESHRTKKSKRKKRGKVAQVHCRGEKTVEKKYNYRGISDCRAVYSLSGGDKACIYACLGRGSCIYECPEEAIAYDKQGLIWIDPGRCTACGRCIAICPTDVIRYVPRWADYIVACNSHDEEERVEEYCSVGCTACAECERSSPEGGFRITENLARVDYREKGERKEASKSCPVNCIIDVTVPELSGK